MSVRYVLLDTPGQIEVFTWSASGTIITESLVSECDAYAFTCHVVFEGMYMGIVCVLKMCIYVACLIDIRYVCTC